jgi:hypothetical protein
MVAGARDHAHRGRGDRALGSQYLQSLTNGVLGDRRA